MTRGQHQQARPWKGRRNVDAACRRWSGNDGGGEIAETGTMFGGGWGRLAARGEGSGGGDGGVALGLSPFFLSLELHTLVFFSLRTLQVKPQERKELCGGREGQTAYCVERKALRCGASKATLIIDTMAKRQI